MCCSWRLSRPSGATSARAWAAWTCSSAGPGPPTPTTARGNTELQRELTAIFATKTCAEWLDFSNEVNTADRAVQHPGRHRRRPPVPGPHRVPAHRGHGLRAASPLPVFVDGDKPPTPSKAPTVGQHTDDVMGDVLGLNTNPDRRPPSRRRLRLTAARPASPKVAARNGRPTMGANEPARPGRPCYRRVTTTSRPGTSGSSSIISAGGNPGPAPTPRWPPPGGGPRSATTPGGP